MKINVEVDLGAIFEDGWCDELDVCIKDNVKDQVMKVVKKDPRYKAYINKKANTLLEGLSI